LKGVVDMKVSKKVKKDEKKWVVREYNAYNGGSKFCITGELSWEEADKIWQEKTQNGTKNVYYFENIYYDVIPAEYKYSD